MELIEYGKWMFAKPGMSCQETCFTVNGWCNAEKQNSLTTNELIKEKMRKAGYECKSFNKPETYEKGTPHHHLEEEGGECTPVHPEGQKSDCNFKSKFVHPLCYCEGFKKHRKIYLLS